MKETKEMYPSWGDDHGVRLGNVKISDLHDFKEHPFHVVEDTALFELTKSIEDKGVLVPLIVRANPYGEGYEIIAGHRRKAACKWAGLSEVPVMIVELDDNEAVIAIVDSILQREHIRPSEKAFAYKMKLEAMKQQGKRTDLTFSQLEKKLNHYDSLASSLHLTSSYTQMPFHLVLYFLFVDYYQPLL